MVELLVPAGNMEMLYQAVCNGADAVYLGGKHFGARAYSLNFSNDEMISAINYCHTYGVKVYVTVNTIIFESETSEFLEYVEFLYKNNVDAVIMQDIGMIDMVHKRFPNLEIHASTQCHNHNEEGVKFLEKLGVKRVVLAREMSLDEVKKLDTNLEKEIFVYGALCVSYSGLCLFSSLNGGRSGNRGCCVACCRLPYKLVKNDTYIDTKGDYLLSTKELNTLSNLREILASGVTSLKIEGRMKSPFYVSYVTRIFRRLIDDYYNGKDLVISEEEIKNLKVLFNREFTSGYLFNDDVINIDSSNHIGILIGKVISVDNKYIKILLSDDIYQEDGIRFKNSNLGMTVNKIYNEKGLLINSAKKGDVILVDNKVELNCNDDVFKTIDNKLNKQLEKYEAKKIKITAKVVAKVNENLKISFMDDDGNEVLVEGSVISKAQNRVTSKNEILEKISKLGNTPFKLVACDLVCDDDVFIPLSEINNLRRNLVALLIDERISLKRDIIINKVSACEIKRNNIVKIGALVRCEEQLQALIDNDVDYAYVDNYDLYLKYKNKINIYYRLPKVIMNFADYNDENILVTEVGALNRYHLNNNIVVDYSVPVLNNRTIDLLTKFNVDRITISPEMDILEYKNLSTSKLEVIVYGRLELMTMKYCPLKQLLNNCANCSKDNNKYYLEDKMGNRFRILRDNCLTTIMHFKNICNIDNISYYKEVGITNYRLDFLDEDYDSVDKIIKYVKNVLRML